MRKLHTISLLVLSLGVFLGLAASLRAQTGALEGEVKGMDGQPLAGVTVEIERTDIKMHFEAKTDEKGYYVYMGLPGGNARYDVSVVREGNRLFTVRGIRLEIGGFKRVDIDLQKERQLQQQQLTEEQKEQIEEQRQAAAKVQSLRENFDLGRQLLDQPSAQLICSSRCPEGSPPTCLTECEGQAAQGLQTMAYQEAIAAFQRAAEADPSQFAVWAQLGHAYSLAEQPEKGIEAYQKAIALKPEEAGTYNNLGQLYVKLGRTEEARKAFETAAQVNPAQAGQFYYNLGVTFYNGGDLPAAVEPLRKATEIDPKRADAFYLLGVCLYGTAESKIEGDVVKIELKPGTREAFEQYLALEPNGRFTDDAKAMLEAIELTAPSAIRVKKK